MKIAFRNLLILLFIPVIVYAASETLVPQAVEAHSGFDVSGCSLSWINESPDATDGEWCLASSNNTATNFRVSYNTPTDTLTSGADLQEMRCLFRPFDAAQTGDPTIHADVYESGTEVENDAGATMLNSDGETIRSNTWNATILTAQSGVNVETLCRCVQTGGSPSVRNTCDHGAVEWNADYTASGGRRKIIIGHDLRSKESYQKVHWQCFNIGQPQQECGVARYN